MKNEPPKRRILPGINIHLGAAVAAELAPAPEPAPAPMLKPLEVTTTGEDIQRAMMQKKMLPRRLRNMKKRVAQGRESPRSFASKLALHQDFNRAFADGDAAATAAPSAKST